MPQVYLLHGQNTVELDDRVRTLFRQLDPTGVGATTIDVSTATIDEISNACHAAPFFGAGRVVLIRGLSAASSKGGKRGAAGIEWKDLLAVVEQSPATTTMLLRADENLPSNSVIVKAARQHGWAVEHHPMARGEELARWVAERGQSEGASFSRNAAMLLLTRLYPTSWRQESRFDNIVLDARLILTEIQKLACASADGAVDEELVAELVADRSGYTAFKLNDLVFSGQSDLALAELEEVLSSGDEPERVLAQFASEAAGLAAAQCLPELDAATVSKASGMSEGRLKMLRQKPASRNASGVRVAGERLRHAEWLVKTGRAPRGEAVIVATAAEVAEAFKRS